MTAFSPPADSWIIRYPNSQAIKKEDVPKATQLEDPCRRYIDGSSEIAVKSNRSLGTDDHFKSAVCSKNLLKVCEKLMINKEFTNFAKDDSADDDFGELSLMNEKSRMEFYRKRHGNRRNSQSLPASPKLERKKMPEAVVGHNPYFTVSKAEQPTQSNISFLTNLFGITAKTSDTKTSAIQIIDTDKFETASVDGISAIDMAAKAPRKLQTKPHEYREMNMFSPTSS